MPNSLNGLAPAAKWIVQQPDPAAVERLIKELGIGRIAATVLANRGYSDPVEADRFLHPTLDQFHDPRKMPDFREAATAILGARERKERIFVHGDYDVDGVTSAALLTRFLRKIGCDVSPHVPHRMKEGYGIHPDAVASAKELGAKLFLTCDCGVGAHDQVIMAKEAGMTVVVTDHHEVPPVLPEAAAVINLHRKDSEYPFPDLAGVGVAFKLCEGLCGEAGIDVGQFYRAYLDLAVLGTVADMMPLVGENRIIARFGLERLGDTKKVGIQELMKVSGVTPPPRAVDIGFKLGPRINAAGRIDDAALSLDLLLVEDRAAAHEIALELDRLNNERKATQEAQLEQAIAGILDSGLDRDMVIVASNADWHGGLVGLIAGKVAERFRRPAFILTVDPETGEAKGSARSIPAFDLSKAIRSHEDVLTGGGGHKAAAGVSLPVELVATFRERINTYAREFLTEDDLVPAKLADAELQGPEADLQSARELQELAPFGIGNPEPLFVVRNAELASIEPTRNPDHLRLRVSTPDGSTRKAMAFSMGERLGSATPGSRLDLLFKVEDNVFNGTSSLQWTIQDVASPSD